MITKELVEEIQTGAREDLPKVQTKEGYIASAEDQDFGVFFSRDAAIDSIFTFDIFEKHPEQPEVLIPVKDSLITMASTQGKVFDAWRDEEPGKIIHEHRHSNHPKNQQRLTELRGKFPVEEKDDGLLFMRYYGSIDATPLFEWVGCEYLLLMGDGEFFKFLNPHIRAAIEWSRRKYNGDKRGFVTYSAANRQALTNQGWKDSSDSILTPEGKRPTEPIALVEVQGYQYQALKAAFELYRKKDPKFAQLLLEESIALKQRFNKDFWMEDEEFFAYALDGIGKQIREITSNVGHLLATGIIDEDKLHLVVNRLMQPDIFTKWGIRTLSVNSPNFSDCEPSAYHNGGGIWTHDNAIIYAGMKRTKFFKEAGMVRDANWEAQYILKKEHGIQNPELQMVDRFGNLRPYKAAQHPQSWADLANLLWTDPLEINSLLAA